MPNMAIRWCAKCHEVGGDKTGFSNDCTDGGRHEPEIVEVSPPLDPTDVYVVGAGAEAVAFARAADAEEFVGNQDGDPAVVPIPVHAPETAVVTVIGGQLNEAPSEEEDPAEAS